MLGWSVRRSKPSPRSDRRRLARRVDPTRSHSERNGSTAPSPTAAAPMTVTTAGKDAACPAMIAPAPPTTRKASTGPGPRSSGSPKMSSSSSSSSSRPRSRSRSRTSGPGRVGTITAARRWTSGFRSFTIVNLFGAHSSPQASSAFRAADSKSGCSKVKPRSNRRVGTTRRPVSARLALLPRVSVLVATLRGTPGSARPEAAQGML